jgi:hypothetical protein
VLARCAGHDPELAALAHLCELQQVPILVDATLTGPYRAITVIREIT